MDEQLLATKGIVPSVIRLGFVDGFELHIGERASLVRRADCRAYGAVMNVASDEAAALYAEDSVADYLPEQVTVQFLDGDRADATCYNLPEESIAGTNREYASSLLEVASRLGFPASYLDQIRRAGA